MFRGMPLCQTNLCPTAAQSVGAASESDVFSDIEKAVDEEDEENSKLINQILQKSAAKLARINAKTSATKAAEIAVAAAATAQFAALRVTH